MDNPVIKPTTDAPKMDASKTSTKPTDTSTKAPTNQGLEPYKIKVDGQTLERGDQVKAKQIVADARARGEITTSDGTKVKTDSPQGKAEIAKIQSIGEGDTLSGANKIAKNAQNTAQRMGALNAVRANQGKPPVTGKPQPAMASGGNR